MKRFLRSKIKEVCHRFGYTLAKIPDGVHDKPYPFIRRYQIGSHAFDFWITNECGGFWYHREGFSGGGEGKALINLIESGDRVLEVGSHHGFYTMLLNQCVGPEGFVLGLEADAQNAQIAQSQIVLNQLGNRCEVHYAAGSDQPGVIRVSTTDGSNAFVTKESVAHTTRVKAVTGDQLQEKQGPFNVLKIDVEGFEGSVLKGCKDILATRPKLALELHFGFMKKYGTRIEEIFEIIDVDQYEGCMVTLPDIDHLVPFNPNNLSHKQNVNIFLRPKK